MKDNSRQTSEQCDKHENDAIRNDVGKEADKGLLVPEESTTTSEAASN
jgi:hypothetical protein